MVRQQRLAETVGFDGSGFIGLRDLLISFSLIKVEKFDALLFSTSREDSSDLIDLKAQAERAT